MFKLFFSECFPNGTITTLAVKLESVPSLNPSELTLLDPTCGPVYSDDRYAYFVFTANSCGTTRKVLSLHNLMTNAEADLTVFNFVPLVFAQCDALRK